MASIKREAQTVDFGTAQRSTGPRDTTSYIAPDADGSRGSTGPRLSTAVNVQSSGLDNLVSSLGQAMQVYGNREMRRGGELAYLEGQAAAAAGKSRSEVEGNIFTRAWAGEGWSDTKGRLGIANSEAQLAADMVKLREQDPEKMKEYLTTRREGLLGLMEGMSMEARKGMMGQMVMSDQHAVVKHQSEHSKFIIDQHATAMSTNFSVLNQQMNAAKGDAPAYEAATKSALTGLWANVINNPNLPKANKEQLLSDAARLALADNNEALYEKMRDLKDESGRAMLDSLPMDERTKLVKAYQESRAKTDLMRHTDYSAQLGLYESRLGQKDGAPISWSEHTAFVNQGIQNGVLSKDKVTALAKKWQDGQSDRTKGLSAATAVMAGDVNGLARMGVSAESAIDTYVTLQAQSGKGIGEIATSLMQAGMGTGQYEMIGAAGKLLKSSINGIINNPTGTVDPGQLQGMNAILKTIDTASENGNESAKLAFLGAFDTETGGKLLTYMGALKRSGGNAQVAAAETANKAAQLAGMTTAQRTQMGAGQTTENTKMAAELTGKGIFPTLWEKVVPNLFRSEDNINRDKLRVSSKLFENPLLVEEAMAGSKMAYLTEANAISRDNPLLSAEERHTLALRNVAARSLLTEGGVLTLPQGQTAQSYFGIKVNNDIISSALNTMHKPAEGNRVVYTANADGSMMWKELSPKTDSMGRPIQVGSGVFDRKSIGPQIRAEQDKVSAEYGATDGMGVSAKGPDGSSVRYNGENTIGIGTKVMLQYRNDLVKFESIRSKPYDDASGKIVNGKRVQTVGVGVSSHNPYYPKVEADGTVSPAEISRSFTEASDAAMKTANEAMQKIPEAMRRPYATRLFGQLAYQGGSVPSGRWTDKDGKKHYDESKDLMKQMSEGGRAKAFEALKKSTQYRMAHAERKQFYERMLDGVMPE